MATLEEIARLAKVSRSTVSRVINNKPRVSANTRERVWSIIHQTDFHPNVAARTLASRRSHIIGLVMIQPYNVVTSEPFSAELVQHIAATCEETGYHLMLSLVSTSKPNTYGQIVRGGYLDGLIVYYACTDDSFVSRLQREKVPFVLIGHSPQADGIFTADMDNSTGAEAMARHLAGLGYTRIATVTGPAFAMSSRDRLEGFLKGLQACGLECPDRYIQEGDFTEGSAFLAMQHLLSQDPQPEAVFVANDTMAVGAIRAARMAHLRVPEDIAITGFDDTPMAQISEPPLTTVHQSSELLGRKAVEMLIGQLEPDRREGVVKQNVVLPVDLVVRESCGARLRLASREVKRSVKEVNQTERNPFTYCSRTR